MSLVYGGDKALDDRLEKALGDTRLTVTLQASRRHLLGFRAPSRSVTPTGPSASTAHGRSAPMPWRARPSCSTASRPRSRRAAAA